MFCLNEGFPRLDVGSKGGFGFDEIRIPENIFHSNPHSILLPNGLGFRQVVEDTYFRGALFHFVLQKLQHDKTLVFLTCNINEKLTS